ncbi:MAG: hypothetical protein ABIR81_00530 [Ginsengibacter sp.]
MKSFNLLSSTSLLIFLLLLGCRSTKEIKSPPGDKADFSFVLIPSEQFVFNSFVDCNMATVWVKDTFRIFPGKYGEDPLWGEAHELKYASGSTVDEVFSRKPEDFIEPVMPLNVSPGMDGLHGAVWFETLYKEPNDVTEKTLYALYHNENYPSTLPYDSATGKGYKDVNWPQGLKGPETKTAVCRIGIMKSIDGGKSWQNKGIVLEDYQSRLILRPHNTGINFAGGVGDPSAVANGKYLYIFYGEYGFPGQYDPSKYDTVTEWKGQCISMARILLSDLDKPELQAERWNGKGFKASADGIGSPVSSIQIPLSEGGGPASSPTAKYYWGPSVSWNTYLNCWVMLMAKAEGPSWKGNSIYISFNKNKDFSDGNSSQQWTTPKLLLKKEGHTLWYPSLQPVNSASDKSNKYTSLQLGQKARLFFKDMDSTNSRYLSEYFIEFKK